MLSINRTVTEHIRCRSNADRSPRRDMYEINPKSQKRNLVITPPIKRYERMLHNRLCSGNKFGIIFLM